MLTGSELEKYAIQLPNPLQSGIYLMKIHGALDIFTFNDGKDLLKLLPLTADWNGFIDVLRGPAQGDRRGDGLGPISTPTIRPRWL